MNELLNIRLGDHIEVLTDYHANGSYEKLKENVTLKTQPDYSVMIRTLNFERPDFKCDLIYLNEEEYNYLSKTKVFPNDILMNKIANPGSVYLMPDIDKPVSLAMNLFLIRFGPTVNQRFMYYLMKSNESYIKRFANGTTTLTITKDAVRDLTFKIPPRTEQDAIADVLSNLEAKIEVNNKINAELEAMAKLIYNYWFVQFDFPDANGKPYKSSGGKMVYNEELKREIPDGWQAKTLDQIVLRIGTGLNPRKNFKLGNGSNYYITIKSISNGKINFDEKCDKVDDEALEIIDRRSDLKPGDILFTSIQPVGVTYLIQEKPLNWNINESVFTIRPDLEKVSPQYLYMLLSGKEMKVYTKQSSTGSIHKGIRHATLKQFRLPCPPKPLIESFSAATENLFKKQNVLDKENRRLLDLRNWLLPMLMNGQVTISKG